MQVEGDIKVGHVRARSFNLSNSTFRTGLSPGSILCTWDTGHQSRQQQSQLG